MSKSSLFRRQRKAAAKASPPVGAVYVAVAAYDGKNDLSLTSALLREFGLLAQAGWVAGFDGLPGCAIVSTARNKLADRFLMDHWLDPDGGEHPFTDLVFIDADVTFERGGLLRLLSHDVDVVFGAPRLKTEPEGYPCEVLRNADGTLAGDAALGLLRAQYGPAGFLRIRRPALVRLVNSGLAPEIVERNAWGEPLGDYRAFFQIAYQGSRCVGEDVWFFERWAEAGGEAWLDPELRFSHSGIGRWAGCVGDFIRAQNTAMDGQAEQAGDAPQGATSDQERQTA
jgi:hypothetical protein